MAILQDIEAVSSVILQQDISMQRLENTGQDTEKNTSEDTVKSAETLMVRRDPLMIQQHSKNADQETEKNTTEDIEKSAETLMIQQHSKDTDQDAEKNTTEDTKKSAETLMVQQDSKDTNQNTEKNTTEGTEKFTNTLMVQQDSTDTDQDTEKNTTEDTKNFTEILMVQQDSKDTSQNAEKNTTKGTKKFTNTLMVQQDSTDNNTGISEFLPVVVQKDSKDNNNVDIENSLEIDNVANFPPLVRQGLMGDAVKPTSTIIQHGKSSSYVAALAKTREENSGVNAKSSTKVVRTGANAADQARPRPWPSSQDSSLQKSVYIGRLPKDVNVQQLIGELRKFGAIRLDSIRIKRQGGEFCHAFVEYQSPLHASNAVKAKKIAFGKNEAYIAYRRSA